MENKYFSKMKLVLYFLFIPMCFVTIAIAGDYTYTYQFDAPQVMTLENGLQIIVLKDTWQKDDIIGGPLIPVKTARIFIPADEKMTSIVINKGAIHSFGDVVTIQHATRPYPLSFKGSIQVDTPDPAIYTADRNYPARVWRERGSQFLCGTQILLVDLMPVVYNPTKAQLKFYKEIIVQIHTEKQNKPSGIMPFRNLPADRNKILRSIDNAADFISVFAVPQSEFTAMDPPGILGTRDYVVITTSTLESAFQALANHRQSAAGGALTTYIETISNIRGAYPGVDDAEKMRNFIIDMYSNYGTRYVVLGGDCDGPHGTQTISTRGCYAQVNGGNPPADDPDYYIPSDLYFGCLDGSWNNDGDSLWGESTDGVGGADIDWYSEVFIGRIPADTAAEATRQIDKIIAYDTGFTPMKTLLFGENLDTAPTWGGDRMDWVYGFMNAMPKTEMYDRDHVSSDWPKSDLLTRINSNDHNWLNHLGHGNPFWNMKLDTADVTSLTNTQYFFSYSQACYSGSLDGRWGAGYYESGDCILEDMVNSNAHGAFASIGNARYGWYNSGSYVQGASNLAHKEFVEAIFTDGFTQLGEANQKSKTQLDLTNGLYRWIAFETNLIGCPVTEIKPVDSCLPAIDVSPTGLEINLNEGQTGQLVLDIANVGCAELVIATVCDEEELPASNSQKLLFPADMPQLDSLVETIAVLGLGQEVNPSASGDIISQCTSGMPTSGLMDLHYEVSSNILYVVSESGDSLIYMMDENCNIIGTLPAPVVQLNGVTFDGTSLWVTDFNGSDGDSDWIYKLDPSTGAVLGSWDVRPNGINGILGIAWDGLNLWATSSIDSVIYKLDSSLNIIDSFTVAWSPGGLAWDGQNLLSVDMSGSIHRVTTGGVLLDTMTTPLSPAMGVSCGAGGLWHSEFATDTLYLLESDWCGGGLCENDAAWLDTVPNNGLVNPGETMVVDVDFDAAGKTQGTYTAVIRIRSNDPEQVVVDIPVTMNVGDVCECDLNNDGMCDMQDWLIFGEDWGRSDCNVPGVVCECDLNKDGSCDLQDWLMFGEDWGRTDCPI